MSGTMRRTARRPAPHTVREALERVLDPDQPDLVTEALRAIGEVLATGGVYRAREITADLLRAGDVILDKRGRTWAVTQVGPTERSENEVGAMIVRGDSVRPQSFDPWHPVRVLLAADDARALDLLERKLGAKVIDRTAAGAKK